MEKTEEWAKHLQNEKIEENGVKSKKTAVLKRCNYPAISKQPVEVPIWKIHEIYASY